MPPVMLPGMDDAQESPMRLLALDTAAAERDALMRHRLQRAASRPSGALEPAATTGSKTPLSPQRVEVSRVPPPPDDLLDQRSWAARYMPELARKPSISKRDLVILDRGYQQYLAQVGMRQRMRAETRQEARDDRLEARHGEDIALRREDLEFRREAASRKAELSPQDAAFRDVLAHEMKANPGDPYSALARAALAAKGGATSGSSANPLNALTSEVIDEQRKAGRTPTQIRETLQGQGKAPGAGPSLLNRDVVQKALHGEQLGATTVPGMLDFNAPPSPDQPPKDKIGGWMKLKQYVDTVSPSANAGEQAKLTEVLRATRPSAQEIEAALEAGYFDPPSDQAWYNYWPKVGQNEARRRAGTSKAIELLRMLEALDQGSVEP